MATTKRTGIGLLAALLLLSPSGVAAQLPSPAELMAAHNQAIGGEAAFAQHQALHTTGTFAIPVAGITGGLETYRVRPNTTLTISVMPGMGELRGGFNGEVGWGIDPMNGARLLGGTELELVRDQARFDGDLRQPENFKSVETVEKTTVGGQECYKVRLVWRSGRETFDCYSVTNRLLIARIESHEGDQGRVEALTLLQDYTDFGGIKLPKRSVTAVLDMEQVITIEKVDFAPPDPARLELPPEIKALIRK
jgi:hypothetical protein